MGGVVMVNGMLKKLGLSGWPVPGVVVVGLVLCLGGVGCSVNPATGRSQFNVLSESREIQIGHEAKGDFLKQYGGEVPSSRVNNYVKSLGHSLASVSERPDLPWEFHVVDSGVLNAFALPGGKVFISRGLLEKLGSEAELAGVLGHEVGHVTAQHIGQQMSQAAILQGIAAGVGVAAKESDEGWLRVLGAGTRVGGGLYLLKFGRDQEVQADILGVRYMTRLGYNPEGQLRVMEVLAAAAKGGGGRLEVLSTHPLPSTRIDHLRDLIEREHPGYKDPTAYRINAESFQENVLVPLGELGPPAHGGGG